MTATISPLAFVIILAIGIWLGWMLALYRVWKDDGNERR